MTERAEPRAGISSPEPRGSNTHVAAAEQAEFEHQFGRDFWLESSAEASADLLAPLKFGLDSAFSIYESVFER